MADNDVTTENKILEPTSDNRFFSLLCNSKKTLLLYMIHKKKGELRYTSVYYTTYYCGDWLLNKKGSFSDKNNKSRLIPNNIRVPSNLTYNINAISNISNNFGKQIQLGLFMSRQRIPVFVETIDSNLLIINLDMQTLYTLNSQ